MQDVTTWLLNVFTLFINAFTGSWGLIGSFIVTAFFLDRVVRFVKRFF